MAVVMGFNTPPPLSIIQILGGQHREDGVSLSPKQGYNCMHNGSWGGEPVMPVVSQISLIHRLPFTVPCYAPGLSHPRLENALLESWPAGAPSALGVMNI